MLTDTALRNLKPKAATYKASDRDGMYVTYRLQAPSLSVTTTVSTAAARPLPWAGTARPAYRSSWRAKSGWTPIGLSPGANLQPTKNSARSGA